MANKQPSIYDLSDEKLLQLFVKEFGTGVVLESGFAGYPPGDALAEAGRIQRAILARMRGDQPPFKEGDRVRAIGENCVEGVRPANYAAPAIPIGEVVIVGWLSYRQPRHGIPAKSEWVFTSPGNNPVHDATWYDCANFEKVEVE